MCNTGMTNTRHRVLGMGVVVLLLGVPATSPGADFLRGNANVDQRVDLSDAVCVLMHLFVAAGSPCSTPSCMDALDVDDDGRINLTDSVYLLSFLYRNAPAPPEPGALFCGPDPTGDSLNCVAHALCPPPITCPVRSVGSFGEHQLPDLAVATDESFVVVWETDREGDGLFDIRAGVYNPDGTERIDPITANTSNSGQQLKPAVGVDREGRFVVVWEDDSNSNKLFQIRARGFNADGTERFPQFNVNESSRGQQLAPDVAVDQTGNFVVVWEDDGDGDAVFDVHVRGFNADGTERFPQFKSHSGSSGQQLTPAIAMDPSGNFVVLWENDGNSDGEFQIEARGFNPDGTQRFAQFTVHTQSSGQQRDPAVAMNSSGTFLAAWHDDRDGDGEYQIHARVFNADSTERVVQFTANVNSAGQQINPAVAINDAGNFVIAWESDRDNDNEYHVRCRRFTPDGTGEIDETKVDCIEPAQHINAAIGIDGSNRVQVFWDDIGASAQSQVLGRSYTLSGP